ncbi:protein FAM151B isoform X2 [Myripristis murdjan]|nr:protein FAM151B isoform X2 [Myripristis murdjan]
MLDQTLDYFLSRAEIGRRDAAEVTWSHATNSRSVLSAALTGRTHMIEADIIMRGRDPREPIMAHPPEMDSDITLREWLEGIGTHSKGIKLDFKSLEAVAPSMVLLEEVWGESERPVWINADILPGPGGKASPLEPSAFLAAVRAFSSHAVLSLGWTTGWMPDTDNPGYSWDMVREMDQVCRNLSHPVSFPVRAALLAQSFPQLKWLLQQSDRYTLTVWTGQNDKFPVEDLLPYREAFDKSRIYYDLPDSQRTQLSLTLGDHN